MLKTVQDACQPDEMAFSYSMTDQIENLTDLIQSGTDGDDFFQNNHITAGMETLLREGLNRLAGNSSQAVFELTQAMGGGKTHSMIAFGLLAKNPETRKKHVPHLARRMGDNAAQVVAFTGRHNPDHYIWGEIASQLGKADEFRKFYAHSPKAPDIKDWKSLIGDDPVLILLDELPPYFDNAGTIPVGNGTLATVATYALSNLLAAALELPRLCIVISNLAGSYPGSSRQLRQIIRNIRDETHRQAKPITPVQLAGNEIYEILKKRLFSQLPREDDIDEVATAFAEHLKEAQDSNYIGQTTPEHFADEIRETYPFHPSIKHLIALFKDNEEFRQTRGLMQFVSRLLQSVWEREQNDVYLVGVQHLDLNKPFVRDEILRINNELNSAITKDIADSGNAFAEEFDAEDNSDAGTQVANIILVASLSKAVNAVSGLVREDIIANLLAPQRKPEEFARSFDFMRRKAWYLHREEGDHFCFKNTENLTKRIESMAETAPQHKIERELKNKLEILFEPTEKKAYQRCIALPKIDEIETKGPRVLLIVNPDSQIPPEEIQRFYESITEKNNILVISGHDSHMTTRVDEAMRELWAVSKIERNVDANSQLYEEVQERVQSAESNLHQAISGAFNYLFYPTNRGLSNYRTTFTIGSGSGTIEKQVENILTSMQCGQKLILDIDAKLDSCLAQAEQRLWPTQDRKAAWRDIAHRAMTNPAFPWLPGARGLEQLKTKALQQRRWRADEEGFVEKGPFPREKTSVNVVTRHYDDRTGKAILELQPRNAGNTPKIHYSDAYPVSEDDPVVESFDHFETDAPHLYFLAVDPSGAYETGEPEFWANTITVRHQPRESSESRKIELEAVPAAEMYYTTDGSNPRQSQSRYEEPFEVPNNEFLLRVFAKAGEVEAERSFSISSREDDTFRIDDSRPATLNKQARAVLDSTDKVFRAIREFKNDENVTFTGVRITIGEGEHSVTVNFSSRAVTAGVMESVIGNIRESIQDDQAQVQVTIRGDSSFPTGDALKRFADICGVALNENTVQQQVVYDESKNRK